MIFHSIHIYYILILDKKFNEKLPVYFGLKCTVNKLQTLTGMNKIILNTSSSKITETLKRFSF